jgi:uncharacterized damage-inducible protein DinB
MKHVVRTFVLFVGLLALTSAPAAAQATVHGDLLKDWTNMKDMMVKIAGAMPDDKFGYKATPAERSYGEQVLHVAQVNVMLAKAIGGKTAAPEIDMKATSKAASVKALSDSFDYGIAVIKEFDNKTIQDTIQAPFMGPSTRARVMFFLLAHTQDIYGQMAVYLRLNGVVPPASVRP